MLILPQTQKFARSPSNYFFIIIGIIVDETRYAIGVTKECSVCVNQVYTSL